MTDNTFASQQWAADLAQRAIGQENQGLAALGGGLERGATAIGEAVVQRRRQDIEEQHFQGELGLQRAHIDIARRGQDLAQQKFQQDKLESQTLMAEREANTKMVMQRLSVLSAVNEQQKAQAELDQMHAQTDHLRAQQKLLEAQAAAEAPDQRAQEDLARYITKMSGPEATMTLDVKTGQPRMFTPAEMQERQGIHARSIISQNYAMFARSAEQAMDMGTANFYEDLSSRVASGAITPEEAQKLSAERRASEVAAPKTSLLHPGGNGAAAPAQPAADAATELKGKVPDLVDSLRILVPNARVDRSSVAVPVGRLTPAARTRVQQLLAPEVARTIEEAKAMYGTQDSGDRRVRDAVQRFLDGLQTPSWQAVIGSKIADVQPAFGSGPGDVPPPPGPMMGPPQPGGR